ncbi:TPR domain protein [hydrothermal vent metagenome]|uniref:TPR domain protein n=1 Tax=hydrothermal vent metagenome TaxID=652676 RepID=A0A3B1DW39_9ZZZZ
MPRPPLQQAIHLANAGKLHDAEAVCRQALKQKPGNPQALRLLGQLTRQTGKAAESVQLFQQLGRARPNDLQLLGELGASLAAANQPNLALPVLRRAIQAMPKAVEWQLWLGRCHLRRFDTPAALAVLDAAHKAAPDNTEITLELARARLLAAEPIEAETLLRGLLEHEPASLPALLALAGSLEQQHRLDEQITILRTILEIDPDSTTAITGLAKCLRAKGDDDEAAAILEPLAVGVLSPANAPAVAFALAPIYRDQGRLDDCKALFDRALALEPLPVPVRASLTFGLADTLHRLRRDDEAFAAYRYANDALPRTFSREHKERMYDDIRRAFDADTLRNSPLATLDASRCLFIVGMPRSGTSLVEQILDAHPLVFGAGELNDLQHAITHACSSFGGPGVRCFESLTTDALNAGAKHYLDALTHRAPEAARITDKMPHNFEMLGLVNRMLPGARVIHCTRHPIDNCLSLYFTQLSAFHSYATNLEDLGTAYSLYRELMQHWKAACALPMIEVSYEDMVADTETNARRIIEFAGLDWDDRCLRFYETDHAVTTASVEQVRQPIYTTSVARWKRYEHHLGPLIESLRKGGVDLSD